MDDLYTTISALHDSNLVATVHYYSYYPFSVNVAGGTRYDTAAQNDLTDAFARMHDTFVDRASPSTSASTACWPGPTTTIPTASSG